MTDGLIKKNLYYKKKKITKDFIRTKNKVFSISEVHHCSTRWRGQVQQVMKHLNSNVKFSQEHSVIDTVCHHQGYHYDANSWKPCRRREYGEGLMLQLGYEAELIDLKSSTFFEKTQWLVRGWKISKKTTQNNSTSCSSTAHSGNGKNRSGRTTDNLFNILSTKRETAWTQL